MATIIMLVAQYDWILFAMPFLELKPQSHLCKFGEEPPADFAEMVPSGLDSWFRCSQEDVCHLR